MNEEFEFSVFGEILNYGNRTDLEINGDDTDEDWYSWDARELSDRTAVVTVYGEAIETQKYLLTWERLQ